MATRTFNNAVINGIHVSISNFVDGSGKIELTGNDNSITTINKAVHNWRGNQFINGSFEAYGDYSYLNTTTTFGGLNQLRFDNTVVSSFYGVITTEYKTDTKITTITLNGEAIDA